MQRKYNDCVRVNRRMEVSTLRMVCIAVAPIIVLYMEWSYLGGTLLGAPTRATIYAFHVGSGMSPVCACVHFCMQCTHLRSVGFQQLSKASTA